MKFDHIFYKKATAVCLFFMFLSMQMEFITMLANFRPTTGISILFFDVTATYVNYRLFNFLLDVSTLLAYRV